MKDSVLISDEIEKVEVTAKDGKTYLFSKGFKTKAQFFISANYGVLAKLLPGNADGITDQDFDTAYNALLKLVEYSGRGDYPQLSTKYIDDNFEYQDLLVLLGMFIYSWVDEVSARVDKAVDSKKK